MRSSMSIIASLILMLLADSTPLAQMIGDSTLRGTVRLIGNGGPLTVVRIQLQRLGMTIREASLRENRFEFLNVAAGRYTLIVDAPGYQTVRQDVDVPGDWPVIDLHPQRGTVQPPEAVSVSDLRVPESARRHFEAALSQLGKRDCVQALDRLKKAIALYAEYGPAHALMGECYAHINQLETAEKEFKRALQQPHAPELHLLLRKIYLREGKQAWATRQLDLYAEETRQ